MLPGMRMTLFNPLWSGWLARRATALSLKFTLPWFSRSWRDGRWLITILGKFTAFTWFWKLNIVWRQLLIAMCEATSSDSFVHRLKISKSDDDNKVINNPWTLQVNEILGKILDLVGVCMSSPNFIGVFLNLHISGFQQQFTRLYKGYAVS